MTDTISEEFKKDFEKLMKKYNTHTAVACLVSDYKNFDKVLMSLVGSADNIGITLSKLNDTFIEMLQDKLNEGDIKHARH